MGSQSTKLVNDAHKQETAINYMKSENSVQSDNKSNSTKLQDIQNEVIYTVFRWNLGGQRVFIVGTFSGWKQMIQLQKDKQGEFSVVVPLEKGIHQYKYIVDDIWRYSPNDPQITDQQGNINNIIDTNKYDRHVQEILKADFKPASQHYSDENILLANKPKEIALNEKAPAVPSHLLQQYYIQEKNKKVTQMWAKQDMEIESGLQPRETFDNLVQVFSNANQLAPPQHVNLNHLGYLNANKDDNFNIFATTLRFKAKYTTLKFYTHKQSDNKQLYV
ncbi:hypothetical protein pb186bvf_019610, partial [Paramecium bursaria]